MLLGEGEAQAEVAEAAVRGTAEARGRAAVFGTEAPAAATNHAVRPTRCTSRIGLSSIAITVLPVLTPLMYIATHVIYSQFIRRLGSYRICPI